MFSTIAPQVSVGSGGSGSYAWLIPTNLVPGTDYRIRVTFLYYSQVTDTSDADFTITNPVLPTIRVTVPDGGESWQAGTTHSILWNYTGNPGPNVTIDLLKGGMADSTIATNVSIGSGGVGSYSWAVPANQTAGTDYQVKVTTNTGNVAYTDTSDGYFSITASAAPSITVTSPHGGESWTRGTTHAITWTYSGDPGPTVRIEGVLFTITRPPAPFTLVASTPIGSGGTGSYGWAIPSNLSTGTTYQITITSTTNSSYEDTSDTYFSIVP